MDRFQRRKRRTREAILRAAAELIREKGLEGLSLEEVAAKAAVSRATLYNHFSDKPRLLAAALTPVFRGALERLEELLARPQDICLDSVAALCLELWEGHQERFGLLEPAPTGAPGARGAMKRLHERFTARFLCLFPPLAARVRFRLADPEATGRLVLRAFVPLLEGIAGQPDTGRLFRDLLEGLITRGPDRG
jgi:AcrR family transcriptional regulator